MKQNNYDKNNKAKNIRKLLLINSDNEMKKKIRAKNYILINSMTPKQLENLFLLSMGPINTSISSYINVLEKHMIEKVVNVKKNINYYYSDFMDKKKRKTKRNVNYSLKSAKDFVVNYDNFFEKKENDEKDNKEDEIINIIPFVTKKKSVGQEKIKGYKFNSLIRIGEYNFFSIYNNIGSKKINNNNEINTKNIVNVNNESNFQSIEKVSCEKGDEKQENKKNLYAINNKLVYYCYTYLKRKRPQYKLSKNESIYGLQVEEELLKRTQTFFNKKSKTSKRKIPCEIKCKSTKNLKEIIKASSKTFKKKEKNTIKIKIYNKKRRGNSVHNKTRDRLNKTSIININTSNFNNDLETDTKVLKNAAKKLISVKSDKRNQIKSSRNSQNVTEKINRRSISINKKIKKKANISHRNKSTILGKSPTHIISKDDTKNSSFDYISSNEISSAFNKNKRKHNNLRLHPSKPIINNYTNKKVKIFKKIKYIKNEKKASRKNNKISQNILKREYLEETKVKDSNLFRKNKKITFEPPIKGKQFSSLPKYIEKGEKKELKECKKIYSRNNPSTKISLINKMKSMQIKNLKNIKNNENNSCDELGFFGINSNISKSKAKLESIKLKRLNSINKK